MSNDSGKNFEDRLQEVADAYAARYWLRLRRVFPPARILGGGKFRRVIFTENPHLDFCGSWTERQGRMIQIEAKSTAKPKLPIMVETGGLRRKQSEAIFDWHRAGACVFLLWECGGVVRFFTVKQLWSACDAVAGGGRKHIRHETGAEVKPGNGVEFDFLQNMRGHW